MSEELNVYETVYDLPAFNEVKPKLQSQNLPGVFSSPILLLLLLLLRDDGQAVDSRRDGCQP